MGDRVMEHLMHPDDLPRFRDHTLAMSRLADGETHSFEYRMHSAENTWRWFLSRDIIYNRDRQGTPTQILGTATDITDLREQQEKVRFQSQLLDNVRESVIATDLAGTIRYWGRGATELYGYRRDEIIGRSIDLIVADTELPRERERIEQAVSQGEWSGEYRQKRGDGSLFWAETFISRVRDEQGNTIGLIRIDHDISERKAREKELAAARAELHLTLEQLPGQVFRCRRETDGTIRLIISEGKIAQQFRLTTDEARGRSLRQIFGREHYDIVRPHYDRAFAGETVTFDMTLADNGFQVMLVPYSPDAAGTITEVIGFTLDITERREMEEQLKLFASTVESSTDAVGMATPNGKHHYQNGAFDDLFGDVGEDPRLSMYVDRETADEVFDTITSGGTWLGEVQMYDVNNRVRDILLRAYATLDKDDHVLSLVGIHTDITDRKTMVNDLRKARNYIANIINSMPSMLIGTNPDGTVTEWNRRAEELTGLAAADAVGHPLDEVLPRLADEMARIRRAVATRQQQAHPKRIHYENGERRFENITVYPLVTNGEEGAVIRIDDTTEQVRLEEMMLQSEKMLSVGGLAAGMAHEINNPLGGMVQNAQNMERRLGDPTLPANQRAALECELSLDAMRQYMTKRGVFRMLKAVREAGDRAASIVENMLSFARRSDTEYSGCDLRDLLERTLTLAATDYDLKKQYDFRNIKLIKEYGDNLPSVPCENSKIQQVLLNVLRNGAEAMHDAQTPNPAFTLRLVHNPEKNAVRVEIADNGPGMDERTLRRVFEPFFTTKATDRGTGLGLSVSYFIIVENHGGEMWAESEPGKGAAFFMQLPLERPGK